MSVQAYRNEILNTLEPLFKEAEEKKLWFHSRYQDLLFSPKELREYHAKESFIWGTVNWTLRDPKELIDIQKNIIEAAQREIEGIEKRMKS